MQGCYPFAQPFLPSGTNSLYLSAGDMGFYPLCFAQPYPYRGFGLLWISQRVSVVSSLLDGVHLVLIICCLATKFSCRLPETPFFHRCTALSVLFLARPLRCLSVKLWQSIFDGQYAIVLPIFCLPRSWAPVYLSLSFRTSLSGIFLEICSPCV